MSRDTKKDLISLNSSEINLTFLGQLKQSSAPKKKFAFKSKKPAPMPTQAAKDTSAEVTSKIISVKPDESAEKDEKVPGIQNISEKCPKTI